MTTESGAVATTAVPEDGVVDGGSGRRGPGTAALALAILLGLLLGFAAGLLAPGLLRPGDGSAEAGFARDMSTHHAQAVEMAILAHEKTTDQDVRTLAADIALTQQAQIGIMQTWLKEWNLGPTSRKPRMAWMPDGAGAVQDGLMPGMASDAERAQLRAATGRDFDALFLKLMLDHHLGGIHMAEGVLDLSDDEQVTAMAESMVAGQKKEIELVRSLQGRIGTP
ncbi:DUF305 domain-containing protein [Micromonospora sp. WMMD1102]|uniref:DUF305 domain-containing protein n=1 Tax=Micromonospora sp. WMMD1102 TaxID=3016105 RepID=UPI002414F3F9|nr:DUF305 domain-containing protein [Micromonospora sp. WMMD1102]MDG4789647.1 DUF305 domain-containing protein [Micromonospora sp. WMMD1102]